MKMGAAAEVRTATTDATDVDVRYESAADAPASRGALGRWRKKNPVLFYLVTGFLVVGVILGIVLGVYYGTKGDDSDDPQEANSQGGQKARTIQENDVQMHLGLTGNPAKSVVVMWVTKKTSSATATSVEVIGDDGKKLSFSPEETATYDYTGYQMHKATLEGLKPGKTYKYQVLLNATTVSVEKNFTAPHVELKKGGEGKPDDQWSFFILGDMGVGPTAQKNVQRMAGEDLSKYDFMMNVGDLAYAYSIDEIWNTYMRMLEPVASRIPWMTCPGNHDVLPVDSGKENGVPMRARFYMPYKESKSSSAHWYSFNHRIVHFTTINTDEDYSPGTEQYKWLEEDLKAANTPEARAVRPWVFVGMHKPMYGSISGRGFDAPRGEPGNLVKNLEPLFTQYKVDVVFTGHQHYYERMFPVKDNGQDVESSYSDPQSPVHLLVGMGGYIQLGGFIPQPAFSAHRELTYGYSRAKFLNASALQFEYVELESGEVHDSVVITKSVSVSLT